ncbi:MAG TPA: hypothetical protein VKC90_02400 [Chitinophagaceae bacterium]|nr:hypothetical protein [Chitinophagaceae bacterium]
MKRINARELAAANKILIIAATCYNLKKWLKLVSSRSNIKIVAMLQIKAKDFFALIKTVFTRPITRPNAAIYFLPVHPAGYKTKKIEPL